MTETPNVNEPKPLTTTIKTRAGFAAIIGAPNAGKSTFVSTVTAATPKIADYPFTTLSPHLGVVNLGPAERFVLADLPGLIEGASEGKGLGHRFLRHIERNSALLFLVPADSDDHLKEFDILKEELRLYNPDLLDKKVILGISKSDLLDEELTEEIRSLFPKEIELIFFSAVSQQNLTKLKDTLWNALQ